MRKQLIEYAKEGLLTYFRDAARSGVKYAHFHGGRAAGHDICVEPAYGSWEEIQSYDYLRAIPNTLAFAWDVGRNGIWLLSDGTYWRPRDGRAVLYQRYGTFTSPLATHTGGTTAAALATPQPLIIPAGLIAPNSRVSFLADVRKHGGTAGTITLNVRLGTAGNASDGAVGTLTVAAAADSMAQFNQAARFGASATSYFGGGSIEQHGSGTVTEQTTNVNTAAVMQAKLWVTLANAADTAGLVGYAIALEG